MGVADLISVAGTAQQHHASVVLRATKLLLLLQFAMDSVTQ